MLGNLNLESLKGAVSDELKKELYYNMKCLSAGASANDFFNEIAHRVDLRELYRVVDTCNYSIKMENSPILLEVMDEFLRSDIGSQYLLQVWNSNKNIIYEKKLQEGVRLWSINHNYFVFLPKFNDEDSQYVHIVDLANNKTVKVENFVNDNDQKFIYFFQITTPAVEGEEEPTVTNYLAVASNYNISIMTIPESSFEEEATINAQDGTIRTLSPKLKLHGIMNYESNTYFSFEIPDNQLDYNRIKIENFESDDYTITFAQYVDIEPRPFGAANDPIVKVVTRELTFYVYTVVLRDSGHFDLYWDFQRKASPPDAIALDVDMTLDAFYFKITKPDQPIKIFKLSHYESRILAFIQAVPITEDENFSYSDLTMLLAQDKVDIFYDVQLVSMESTYLIIAHRNYISFFNLLTHTWAKHTKINCEGSFIRKFFQIQNAEGGTEMAVLMQDNDFYKIEGDIINNTLEQIPDNLEQSQALFRIEGTISDCAIDYKGMQYAFFIHHEDEKTQCKLLYKGELRDMKDFGEIDSRTNLVPVQVEEDGENMYVLNQNITDKSIQLYHFETEAPANAKEADKNATYPRMTIAIDFGIQEDLTDYLKIHSAILYHLEEHLIIYDKLNMYILNCLDKTCVTFKHQQCLMAYHFTKQINYAICDAPPGNANGALHTGLRLYDLEEAIENDKYKSILMKNYQIGCNSSFFYSESESRIAYFNTIKYATIVPLLHSNVIKFVGLTDPEAYLAYKVVKDKFIGLDNKGNLNMWNMVNGKYLSTCHAGADFTDYVIHSPEGPIADDFTVMSPDDDSLTTAHQIRGYSNRQDKALIRSSTPIEDYVLQDYYQDWQLNRYLGDEQETYIEGLQKNIVRWQYIEIVNEKQIKTHFSFVHPSYDFQYMYINSNADLMIERLKYTKTYLYKKQQLPDNQIKWELIRKIGNFDVELESNKHFLPFYSPDFSLNIEMDRKQKVFLVKDTITNRVVKKIPRDLLAFGDEEEDGTTSKAISAINRTQWLDNSRFRIVSTEGYEKIVDMSDNWKELEFNSIPLFEGDKSEWIEKQQYFYQKSLLSLTETEAQLRRKYQEYKSLYNLFHKVDKLQLYEELFAVDTREIDYTSLSFTFLHWNLIEQICQGHMSITDVNKTTLQVILYNILPGGNTILHKFADNEQGDDIEEIFKISQPNLLKITEITNHVPIIQNIDRKTALHICKIKEDYKSIDTMLKYLKGYPLDHHSRAIKDLIPSFIEKGVPEIMPYLASRMIQTSQVKKIIKGKLSEDDSGIIPTQAWFNNTEFQAQISGTEGIDKRIKCEYIDIPFVYHYQDSLFPTYFEALAGTDNFDYFKNKTIQKIILFNFPLVREFTLKKLFIPFCAFIFIFVTYFNFVEGQYNYYKVSHLVKKDDEFEYVVYSMIRYFDAAALLGFATYFFLNEFKQLLDSGIAYLGSIWNYIDILPPIGIYTLVTFSLLNITDPAVVSPIQAITTFFMWLKFLYFMRIFKDTSYLIRMIVEVIFDMRNFLFVLFVALTAFGNTFLALSNANDADNAFSGSFIDSILFSYRMILGDFDTGAFGSVNVVLVWIFFMMCTIFGMIVMLNLLIAIISESFGKVNSNAESAMYQEMASLISENHYLIPEAQKAAYAKPNIYLLVITDLDNVENEFSDPVQQGISEIKAEASDNYYAMLEVVEGIKTEVTAFKSTFDTIKADLAFIKKNFGGDSAAAPEKVAAVADDE